MIKTTRWSPDTCGCIIDFDWDTDFPNNEHVAKNVVRACEIHTVNVNDPQECLNNTLKENRTKNKVINSIIEAIPSLSKLDSSGRRVMDEEKLSFSYDENRKLVITSTADSIIDLQTINTIITENT